MPTPPCPDLEQYLFQILRDSGRAATADKAKHQIVLYHESQRTPKIRPPLILDSDFARFFTLGITAMDRLIYSMACILTRAACCSIYEYLVCSFAMAVRSPRLLSARASPEIPIYDLPLCLQEFLQRVNDAMYAMKTRQILLPLTVAVEAPTDLSPFGDLASLMSN